MAETDHTLLVPIYPATLQSEDLENFFRDGFVPKKEPSVRELFLLLPGATSQLRAMLILLNFLNSFSPLIL